MYGNRPLEFLAEGDEMDSEKSLEDNVINLFKDRKPVESKRSLCSKDGNEFSLFEEIMRRNEDNNERLKKDRLQANKKVLHSYRIKKK